jgi:hypothetical protein
MGRVNVLTGFLRLNFSRAHCYILLDWASLLSLLNRGLKFNHNPKIISKFLS